MSVLCHMCSLGLEFTPHLKEHNILLTIPSYLITTQVVLNCNCVSNLIGLKIPLNLDAIYTLIQVKNLFTDKAVVAYPRLKKFFLPILFILAQF